MASQHSGSHNKQLSASMLLKIVWIKNLEFCNQEEPLKSFLNVCDLVTGLKMAKVADGYVPFVAANEIKFYK